MANLKKKLKNLKKVQQSEKKCPKIERKRRRKKDLTIDFFEKDFIDIFECNLYLNLKMTINKLFKAKHKKSIG